MNNLPKVVTQQCRGRASNPRLLDRKSDALPLSHRATLAHTSWGADQETLLHLYLSYDPNLIMAALFMDLLVALTCGCLILFKTILFVCAWVLTELLPHPVYAWKQMSPPLYFRR